MKRFKKHEVSEDRYLYTETRTCSPLIDNIFAKAHGIHKPIKKNKGNSPKRECSNRLCKALVYLVNNESRLNTFLDNSYGVMTNNATEKKLGAGFIE